MNILATEISYRTASLEMREQLSFTREEQKLAIQEIYQLQDVNECVLLSTCNRSTVFVYVDQDDFDIDRVQNLLCRIKGLDLYDFKKFFNVFCGLKAVQHLFKVACGLDSMVLGEDQILAQVKNAGEMAMELGTSSSVLNKLFREAVTAAKRAKTLTGISKNPVSVGTLAIKMLMELRPDQFQDQCFLLVGTGEIGTATLKNLLAKDVKKIYVTNRTHGKIEDWSKIYLNVALIDYNARYSVMDECDIVISATMSPHYTVTKDLLEKAITTKKERIFVDLAVPRDFDAAIKELPTILYYTMEDLKVLADQNVDKRKLEITRVEEIIAQNIMQYQKWYEFKDFLPLLREIQAYTDSVAEERIKQTLQKLKNASPAEKEIVRTGFIGVTEEILNQLVYSVRDHGSQEEIGTYFTCLKNVLDKKNEKHLKIV